MKQTSSCAAWALFAGLSLAGLAFSTFNARAAITEIASAPLLVASPTTVKANLLFVLDDSGSMNLDLMPDHVANAYCRSSGAGLDAANYSGSFNNECCPGAGSSTACWSGNAPFSRRGEPLFLTSSFNGMAYNPAIRYSPPLDASGNAWANQTSANTAAWTLVRNDAYRIQNTSSINLINNFPDSEWCTDAGYTDCLRNGNYVLPGRVGEKLYQELRATTATGSGFMAVGAPDAATKEARTWGPHYYNVIPSEYCKAIDLRVCQTGADAAYTIPAPLRWCNSDAAARASAPAAGACQAVKTDTYSEPRFPTKYSTTGTPVVMPQAEVRAVAQFRFGTPGCSISMTAVNAGALNLLAYATSATSNRDNLGLRVIASINAGTSGYFARTTDSGRTVNITAPAGVNTSASITFSRTPNCSLSVTPSAPGPVFQGYQAAIPLQPGTPAGFGGRFERVDIIADRTAYPKSTSRTDCAGASCSYEEEMTNFANWWTYYHSRMQSMKSSAAQAFGSVGSNRRVGYLSINNSTANDYLNLDTFETTQRSNWYSKLVAAKPSGSTPLRTALAKAGRLYGGKLNGTTLNGSTVKDPMLYSCQQNFTILSTDGYWNESADPTRLNGSDTIDDQDSSLPRPMLDGANTSNTLADTAAYYYRTDLRTGVTNTASCKSGVTPFEDVCGNSTSAAEPDAAQTMRTFTLGLGAAGFMQFRPDYLSAGTGDFFAIEKGSTANPSGGVCTWQASGSCNWPAVNSNEPTTIDDLWHAAVNGGGAYFSATDPSTLIKGLSTALKAIDVQVKAAAAATTSNPNVASGDNQVFVSNFSSGEWSGDLQGQRIDVNTGEVLLTDGAIVSDWSARDLLNANTSRTIYMFDAGGGASKRKIFSWDTMGATAQGNFSLSHITGGGGTQLSQFCTGGIYCVPTTSTAPAINQAAAAGKLLVEFLTGSRAQEGDLVDVDKAFRKRAHLLGDIVNSEAVYVAGGQFDYTDTGYAGHKTAIKDRAGMVYVGANDGMLHAFNAATGAEVWAYVPTLMLPKLYRLADREYASGHTYFVDGTPTVQDVYDSVAGAWRTLLVSGMGAGGRGYFAIDITVPTDPKPLWEFTDDNLGYSMGKAEIGKLSNGSWAVFFGSGYNNVTPGDGKGRLFIVDASTGVKIGSGISTEVGDSTTPSGLAHIRAWVDDGDVNNSVARIYGGDNLGNLWRFDVNNTVGAAGADAQLLATLRSPTDTPQPITSRPELGQVGSLAMVYVGTGRYLGQGDLSDTGVQTIYAIKDRLGSTSWGNPRTPANSFVQQTLTLGSCPAGSAACSGTTAVRLNSTPQPVNLATDGGWYVDLPIQRERVNTDPQLALGTLVVNSNVIESGNICKVGGSSWANFLDYASGAPISTAKGVASVSLGNAIATRPALIKLPNNRVISISRLSDNRTVSTPTPVEPAPSATRRLSWRDLIQN
jgi:type IV pilus assembly protein PilY1